MKTLVRWLDGLMKFGIIMTTSVMMIACALQVFSRYILPHPLSWTEEVARYSFIWWSFLGAAYVVRLNGHLGMDVLVNLLPRRLMLLTQRIVFLITLAFMVIVTVEGVKIVKIQAGQSAVMLPISMGWIYGVVPFTGLVMVIYLVYLFFYWKPPETEVPGGWMEDKTAS